MPQVLASRSFVAIFLIALTALLLPAQAQALREIPALSAPAIDQTGTLQAAELQALQARLQAIEQQYGAQVVVLMVPGTAPEDIAAFANRVGNQWKIGRRGVGDGVLVIVAKDERRMRIEVVKALEGAIPDIAAAQIIDTAMKPRFRQGDYAGGLMEAAEQLRARIAHEDLPPPQVKGSGGKGSQGGLLAGVNLEELLILGFLAVAAGGQLARRVLGRLLGSLAMGAGMGALAFVVSASWLVAGLAGIVTLVLVGLAGGRSGSIIQGGMGGGGWGGGWTGGSGRGGGFGGGGGFGSGGGGDFGGGGASGDW